MAQDLDLHAALTTAMRAAMCKQHQHVICPNAESAEMDSLPPLILKIIHNFGQTTSLAEIHTLAQAKPAFCF